MKDKKTDTVARVIALVQKKVDKLFHDERDNGYVALQFPEGRRILAVKSTKFKGWIKAEYFQLEGKGLSSEHTKSVRETLEGIAMHQGKKIQLHIRSAHVGNVIWIDLDGIRAVRVEAGSWQVVERPPILFRSHTQQRALPIPKQQGNLKDVLGFVNLQSKQTQLLFLCYLVSAQVPTIQAPLLAISGPMGSAKSTLARIAKSLVDPTRPELVGSINMKEWAVIASLYRMLVFDNVSKVPPYLADALCRGVTGEGESRRKLFTDEDTVFFEFMLALAITSINPVASKSDLLDRCLLVELESIGAGDRREQVDLLQRWEEAR